MYLKHFGLQEPPFSLTPDTQFFLNSASHHEALNLLLVALESSEGFIKITGEVGTGKTLLCRKLLNTLSGEKYITAYIPNPDLNSSALTNAFVQELAIKVPRGTNKHTLMQVLSDKLIKVAEQGKKVVLLIDEAQSMPEETMEALRLLTNLETEKQKLLQVVLFGQPELNKLLKKHNLRQLKQRITFSYELQPFDREGVGVYLSHRLHTAGYNGSALFSEKAITQLHSATEGIPRVINILAHKAMMVSFGQGLHEVDINHVNASVDDTEGLGLVQEILGFVRHKFAWVCLLTGVVGVGVGVLFAWVGASS